MLIARAKQFSRLLCGSTLAISVGGLAHAQIVYGVTPTSGDASSEQWSQRGFQPLHLPELGSTRRLMSQLNSAPTLVPGVGYDPPQFPAPQFPAAYTSRPGASFVENGVMLRQLASVDALTALTYWVGSQAPGGTWDFKIWALSPGDRQPLRNMGYFNGAYTIAPFLDEDTVIGGYGIVKKNNYAISGMASDVAERVYAYFYTPSTGYRDILDGNMIYGYVYARMGYEYYSSGEEIREFIDAGQLAPPGIGADTLETFKAAMRIPASEEYLRRWTALEQDARRLHDEKLFAEMQDIERQAAIQKEQQLEQRERAWRAAHQNPPPPSFSPSQVPAQPWTPPPLPSFTAPSQPIVVPYRAPPPPQLYWGHPQGGSGECEDCNDDTNNGGGSIDLGPPT